MIIKEKYQVKRKSTRRNVAFHSGWNWKCRATLARSELELLVHSALEMLLPLRSIAFLEKRVYFLHVDQGPNQDGDHHITISYYWVPLVCSPPTSPTYHKWSYWISFLIYFCPPQSTKTDFFFNCLSTLTNPVGSCSKILPAQSHFLLIMG